MKNEIVLSDDENLTETETVKVVAKIAYINFIYKPTKKRFHFIRKRIKKLDNKIIPLILIEIMKICISKVRKK